MTPLFGTHLRIGTMLLIEGGGGRPTILLALTWLDDETTTTLIQNSTASCLFRHVARYV